MSIRVLLCFAAVIGFSVYAWKNWFVSLCALILLMAFLQHPDMPHSIAHIQGLNPWNLLMANVFWAWWVKRRQAGFSWDMPPSTVRLFLLYLFVIVWSFMRMLDDYQLLGVVNNDESTNADVNYSLAWVTSEYLINCVKWVLPGILLFDACRTRRRVVISLFVVLTMYSLLALQTVKHMPLRSVAMSGGELSALSARLLDKGVGYFRSELSMMFSGASWAILCLLTIVEKRRDKLILLAAAAGVTLAQAETGGRAGYVTWGLIGVVFSLFRWRRYLVILPLMIMIICVFLPGVRDRMLVGFNGSDEPGGSGEVNTFAVTSGRVVAWRYVIDKIAESPVIGYGRQAMIRIGLYQKILTEQGPGESFPHPHNAYLELLLDDGFVGFFLVIPFYIAILWQSFRLLMDRSDPIFGATGGVALALILGLMVAAMGGETFYPRESSLGMWCAVGVMLRIWTERKRSRSAGESLFQEEEEAAAEADSEHEPEWNGTPA